MVRLKINNQEIEAAETKSVLEVVKNLGIQIPTLCWHKELDHFTSCMVCLVKNRTTGNLIPSCSVKVTEGMDIITSDDEIIEARKTALELLLSEHIGDCEAPCQIACPAHMNIPMMNRLIASGNFEKSLQEVLKDIALPSVLGRICPAPCEGACKRKPVDNPVSICLLKRFVGDYADIKKQFFINNEQIPKKIAIIGSGPAGLAASYYLQLKGFQCTIFEKNSFTGGKLRTDIPKDKLPSDILDKEINYILSTGIKLELNSEIDKQEFEKIQKEYDAVIIASGNISDKQKEWSIVTNPKGIEINKNTYETNLKGVFAIGNVLRPSRLAVRSVGQGKEVAFSVFQFLNDEPVKGETRLFNSKFGKLLTEEYTEYLKESVEQDRLEPSEGIQKGFTREEAINEAKRCLHCDCRKLDNCSLRDYSEEYQANQQHFLYGERKKIEKHFNHELVIYEPNKCIKCGICVRLTEKYREKFGFTYIGRGFTYKIGAPFNETMKNSLKETAKLVADACPTGAISMK